MALNGNRNQGNGDKNLSKGQKMNATQTLSKADIIEAMKDLCRYIAGDVGEATVPRRKAWNRISKQVGCSERKARSYMNGTTENVPAWHFIAANMAAVEIDRANEIKRQLRESRNAGMAVLDRIASVKTSLAHQDTEFHQHDIYGLGQCSGQVRNEKTGGGRMGKR